MPVLAFANSAYLGVPGKPITIQNSSDIVLEKQVMQVWLRKSFAEVENVYQLYNAGEAQEFAMGLPEDVNSKASILYGIYNFNAYVGGGKAEVRTKKTKDIGIGSLYGDINWHVHNVYIPEHERRVVVHKYWVKVVPWKNKITVPLAPAATWRGRIGRIYYVVHLSGSISEGNLVYPESYGAYAGKYSIQPVGFKPGSNQITWAYSNYEPQKDMHLEVFPGGNKPPLKIQVSGIIQGEEQKSAATNAIDEDPATAWGVGGPGKGEWIVLYFDKKKWVREFRIIPGYAVLEGMFKFYNRPHEITLRFSDGTKQQFEIRDELDMQYLPVKPVLTKYVKVEIDSVYQGIYPDVTYISEIEFGDSISPSKVQPAEWKTGLNLVESVNIKPKYSTTDLITMAATVVVFFFIGWQVVVTIINRKKKVG